MRERERVGESRTERRIIRQDLERYHAYLIQEERAAATISKYMHDVRMFYEYLSRNSMGNGEGCLVSKEKILPFKEQLIHRYQIRSVNSMLAALNSFLTFMGWGDFRVKFFKVQAQLFSEEEKELSREEYFRLIQTAGEKKKERLVLVLQTLCGLGLRISELKAVTVEAVKDGKLQIYNKGKSRLVWLGKPLQRKLSAYIRRMHLKQGEIFITKSGKSLDRSNIWREMKHLCEDAKVPCRKIFPHNLRHLFARTFYEMRKDVVKLAAIMGHSSMETTRIYTAVSGQECRRQMEALRLVL